MEDMSRLLSPQNRPHLVIVVVALIARALLGWIPLIGGILGFGLLLVALWHIYKVATNYLNASPA